MTGGGAALPYFNAFMNGFLKDKPKEAFPGVPPIPAEIRTLMERNKREELEKLERADQAAIKSGATTEVTATTDPTITAPAGTETGSNPTVTETRPSTTEAPPPVTRPVAKPPTRDPDPPKEEKPVGSRRKGKKGDN